MWTGIVRGKLISTMKHPTLQKAPMAIVQPIHPMNGEADGLAQVVMNTLSAGVGQRVLISGDGSGCQAALSADKTCPARLYTAAILHETSIQSKSY